MHERETYRATRATPLIDDELWPELIRRVREAKRRIDLSQLLFEPSFRPLPGAAALADELERAAQRGVRVRLVMNENAAIPDSYDEIKERFAGTTVEVARLPMTPNVLHVKFALVDDDAFLVDSPFEQKYADARTHAFDRAARDGAQPLHAVSLALAGPVVARLTQLYDALWDGTDVPPPSQDARTSTRGVGLAWTAPPGVWGPREDEGVLAAYERAIGRAERYVYVENQYFTSPRVTAALADALARKPRLEAILVLNENMDVPTYDAWQALRLSELGFPDHPRLGVFTLYAPRRRADAREARRVYIHSKVAIVDDAWATIGSANLDSISLHEAVEFPVHAPPNVELNAVLEDPAFATALRRRLWGEHLGDEGVWRGGAPEGGWLAHWRRVAEANAERIRAGDAREASHVVPFSAIGKATKPRRVADAQR